MYRTRVKKPRLFRMSRDLKDATFYFLGKARIRVQLSAAHSTDDVNSCVDAFIDVRKSLGVAM